MPIIDCFKIAKRNDLAQKHQELISKGVDPYVAAREVMFSEHEKLHEKMNGLKKSLNRNGVSSKDRIKITKYKRDSFDSTIIDKINNQTTQQNETATSGQESKNGTNVQEVRQGDNAKISKSVSAETERPKTASQFVRAASDMDLTGQLEGQVMQSMMGVKLSREVLYELLGSGGKANSEEARLLRAGNRFVGKSISGEIERKGAFLNSKKGEAGDKFKSVDSIVHHIWENLGGLNDSKISESEIKKIVEDTILSFDSPSQIAEHIYDNFIDANRDMSKEFNDYMMSQLPEGVDPVTGEWLPEYKNVDNALYLMSNEDVNAFLKDEAAFFNSPEYTGIEKQVTNKNSDNGKVKQAEEANAEGQGQDVLNGAPKSDNTGGGNKPPVSSEPTSGEKGGENKVGVSHDSLTQLAKKLGFKEPVAGESMNPEEYADMGRKLLASGISPDEAMNPNNDLHVRIAIARAHFESLVKKADSIARDNPDGVNSKEYVEANKQVEDYATDVNKKLGNLWHQAGQALQGERDLDTDSFTAVKKAVEKLIDKGVSEEQTKKIKELTDKNELLKQQYDDLNKKLIEETDKVFNKPEVTRKQKAKLTLDEAKLAFKKAAGLSSGGLEALPEFIKLVKAYAEYGYESAKLAFEEFKKDFPTVNVKQEDFEKHYDDAVFAKTPGGKNIKRLEKELEDLRSGIAKQSGPTRDLSEREKLLQDEIKSEKEKLGLIRSKMDKPLTNDEIIEADSKELENIQKIFEGKKDNKFTFEEGRIIWDYAKKHYLDNNVSYKDMVPFVSADTGLTWRQIISAISTSSTKTISDAMWKKQSDRVKNQYATKSWVEAQNVSIIQKAFKNFSGAFRSVAIFGHGGIFVGTHAGMTFIQMNPKTAKYGAEAFLNGYKFAYGDRAKYEMRMEELKNSPNYIKAQRAGLVNNPDRINLEDYQNSQHFISYIVGHKIGDKVSTAGEHGFNAIKILRQNLFDYHYNKLSEADKADKGALESIANLINNATGATNLDLTIRNKKGETIADPNELFFAAGMESARWGKLTRNPIKATGIALKALYAPDKVTTKEKVFARVWASRVGQQLAGLTTVLLANAAIQNKINPSNPVNLTNPNESDFMKLKFGEKTIDPTSGMRSTAMFIYGLGKIPFMTKQERSGDAPLVTTAKSVFGYGRGKLAPFYSTMSDFFLHQDYNKNEMPFSDEKPIKGKHKLTWKEYAWQKAPLPIAEAANEAYKAAIEHGADKPTLDNILTGIVNGTISGSTGFRVGKYNKEDHGNPIFSEIDLKRPVFKYFIDKKIELPSVDLSEYEIHDKQTNTVKPISEYPKTLQDEYKKVHKEIFARNLERVLSKGFVYVEIDDKSKVSTTRPEGGFKYPHERVALEKLTSDQLKNVLSDAHESATDKAKKKVFKGIGK